MSSLQTAGRFVRAVVRHALDGFTNVSPEEYERRLNICRQCEFFDRMTCRRCGCFLAVKAHWASESCPEEKWQAQTDAPGGCNCTNKKTGDSDQAIQSEPR